MIVIFGATSDIGRRVTKCLLDDNLAVRVVSRRSPQAATLDPRASYATGDLAAPAKAAQLKAIVADAEMVISCAHARYTARLLNVLPRRPVRLVLVGSAWRYSHIPEPRAELVRSAEAEFLASGRPGVMLHPTMIYGGFQENNLQRLIGLLRKISLLPLPGGGRNLVQPIHVGDVADAIVAATRRDWAAPTVIPLAGPQAMPWREMAHLCARAMGRRLMIVPVPLGPAIAGLEALRRLRLPVPLDPNVLRRFREDVEISTDAMRGELGINPRSFADSVADLIAASGA